MPQRKYVMLRTYCQSNVATVLLLNLLLQGCQAQLDALEGHYLPPEVSLASEQEQVSGQISTALTTPSSSALQHPTTTPTCSSATIPAAVERPLQHTTTNQAALQATQASSRIFTTSSGEHVRFTHENGQWLATLQSSSRAYTPQRTFPVVSPAAIGSQLAWLQAQDIWTSKARIHIMPTSIPPYTSCVYLGKCGLFGGMFGRNSQELPERIGHTRQSSGRVVKKTVRAIPSFSSLCLESLLTAHKDRDYRRGAESDLVEAAKVAPEQVLGRLLTTCATRPEIRKTVSKAFVEATKMAPEYTLERLLTACKSASTQQAAVSVLRNIAMKIPQLMLTSLQAACREEDPFVRQAAVKTLENVAKTAPELASVCLETIILATGRDESDLVRDSAFKVLLDVAKAVPKQALASLLAVGKDENWYTRYAVIMALLEVAQAAPEHASACLQPLQDACTDEDQGVCQAAIYALEETKAALKCYERGI
jgi:hypothetical protein